MESLRRRPDAPGPYGPRDAGRRFRLPGTGPRAAADGQPLGVGDGGRLRSCPIAERGLSATASGRTHSGGPH